MDEIITKLTADFLKTLSHPVRIKILKMLAPGERCVCELISEIEIEQSNLSQHLAVLRKQGIIIAHKDGTKVIYKIVHPAILEILQVTEKILGEQIRQKQDLLKILNS